LSREWNPAEKRWIVAQSRYRITSDDRRREAPEIGACQKFQKGLSKQPPLLPFALHRLVDGSRLEGVSHGWLLKFRSHFSSDSPPQRSRSPLSNQIHRTGGAEYGYALSRTLLRTSEDALMSRTLEQRKNTSRVIDELSFDNRVLKDGWVLPYGTRTVQTAAPISNRRCSNVHFAADSSVHPSFYPV
jgi:hypothetical protein